MALLIGRLALCHNPSKPRGEDDHSDNKNYDEARGHDPLIVRPSIQKLVRRLSSAESPEAGERAPSYSWRSAL